MRPDRVQKTIQFIKNLKHAIRWVEEDKSEGVKLIRLNHNHSKDYTVQEAKDLMSKTWRLLGKVK